MITWYGRYYGMDVHYKHAKRVWKDFEINSLDEYHNLYIQIDLLLADVFENFCNKCFEIYKLDPNHILSSPWWKWEATLKK